MSDWNAQLIAALRANNGEISEGPMAGRPLMVLTTKGARTGSPREAVLTYSRDGDRYVVAASAGGSPTDPDWYRNVQANPAVQVEAKGETFNATASVAQPAERERLWAQHVEARPEFANYPEQSGRTIPVVTLQRID